MGFGEQQEKSARFRHWRGERAAYDRYKENLSTAMPSRYRKMAATLLRVALGLSFLSAVGDRFGLWGAAGTRNVAWGTFTAFLDYTRTLLWFLPSAFIKPMGWLATISEFSLGAGLLIGFRLRWFALASSFLLFTFAATMTFARGAEPAFSYSVWTASAAALLLSCIDIDEEESAPRR
jgi:uncharacterized membrane protein YphA (DoxX/SURF4 family)